MADYFDYLPAFVEEVLSLDHPHLGPFLGGPLFVFLGLFDEGEFVHEDSVQAHSQTHHIAFLVVHVVPSDKPVGELLHLMLFHDKILEIWFSFFFFLLEPFIHPITSVKTSNFYLETSGDEYVFKLNEVDYSFFVEILHQKAYLSHNV